MRKKTNKTQKNNTVTYHFQALLKGLPFPTTTTVDTLEIKYMYLNFIWVGLTLFADVEKPHIPVYLAMIKI